MRSSVETSSVADLPRAESVRRESSPWLVLSGALGDDTDVEPPLGLDPPRGRAPYVGNRDDELPRNVEVDVRVVEAAEGRYSLDGDLGALGGLQQGQLPLHDRPLTVGNHRVHYRNGENAKLDEYRDGPLVPLDEGPEPYPPHDFNGPPAVVAGIVLWALGCGVGFIGCLRLVSSRTFTHFLIGLLLLGVMVGCTWTACALAFSDYIATHPVRIRDPSTTSLAKPRKPA